MKIRFTLLCVFLIVNETLSQSVSINSTGAVADTSAMLDIQSSEKGVLIPRMTSLQREAIFEPAEGLLVFDSDTRSFWFRQNNQWSELVSGKSGLRDMDNDTRVEVEANPDEDVIRFTAAGHEYGVMDGQRFIMGNDTGSIYIGREVAPGVNSAVMGNTVMGQAAGNMLTTGASNTLIGRNSGKGIVWGSRNVAIGDSAMVNSTSHKQTAVGFGAAMISDDSLSTFIGYNAGKMATGTRGTYIGHGAGYNDTGFGNTIIGTFAGNDSLSSSANTIVGKSAGSALRTGGDNTFIGESSGLKTTSGGRNTFIGRYSGFNNIAGEYNTFTGTASGYRNIEGNFNTFVGSNAGLSQTVGYRNTFLGVAAGQGSSIDTFGNDNTALGAFAGSDLNSGTRNTLIGSFSGYKLTTGSRNTALGVASGNSTTSGERNVFIGDGTGYENTTGSRNTFVGEDAGLENTVGSNNTLIGQAAGANLTIGNNNVIAGDSAAYAGTQFHGVVAVGHAAGKHASDSLGTYIGFEAGKLGPGVTGVYVGYRAGYNSYGKRNTIIGTNAGIDSLSGSDNAFLGYEAGRNNGTGNRNSFIGANSGSLNTIGYQNTALGRRALYLNTTGNDNTGIGNNSLASNATGVSNTALGSFSVYQNQYGSRNIGVGTLALASNVDGSDNIGIGFNAMPTHTNGTGNIGIGSYANTGSDSLTYATAIGFRSRVETDRSIVLGYRTTTFGHSDKVGIGTPSPTRELDIFDVNDNGDAGINIAADNPDTRLMTIAVTQSSGGLISMVTNNDLFLRTNNTNRMTIRSNGMVGIGTTTPPELLTVRSGSIYAEGLGGSDSNKGFLLGESPGAPAFGLVYDGTGAGGENKTHLKEFVSGDTSAVMTFKGSGDVGVGTTTPDTDFEIERSGSVTSRITSGGSSDVRLEFKRTGGGSDWRINNSGGLLLFGQSSDDLASVTDILRLGGGSVTPATDNAVVCGQSARRWTAVWAVNGTIQTSDATMKSNIQPLNSGLNIIGQLTPVSYQWNNTSTDNGKTHIGFLAQNLQQALPEVVYDHEWIQNPETGEREWAETRHLGINYSEIIPVLVRGIQEQQELISQLQLQNERLEQRITVLEQSK